MPFRIQARHFFITYPQCDIFKQELLDHLKQLFGSTVKYIVVSQERHADGNRHLHAYINLSVKKDIKNERFFDLQNYHPNVQPAHDAGAVIKYVKKDGDFIEFGENTIKKSTRDYSTLLEATNKDDFLKKCKEHFPHEYIFHLEKVQYFADQVYRTNLKPYVPRFTTTIIPPLVQQWLDQRSNGDRPRSLIL